MTLQQPGIIVGIKHRSRRHRRAYSWGPADLDFLRRLLLKGHTYAQCAEKMQCSRDFVFTKAKAAGLRQPKRERRKRFWNAERLERLRKLYCEGLGWDVIAEAFGRPRATCQSALHDKFPELPKRISGGNRDYRPWTADDLDRVHALHEEGKDWLEIGAAVSHSPRSCLQKWHLGNTGYDLIPQPKQPPPPKRRCIGPHCCAKPLDKRFFQPEHKWNYLCESCAATVRRLAV